MSTFVLDSSIALAWCFEGERTPALESLESHLLTASALVPPIWSFEVANVLTLAVRKGRITAAERLEYLAIFRDRQIAVDPLSMKHAWTTTLDLADRHALTVYDAAYLELAVRRGIPLATLDAELRQAARTEAIQLLGMQ